MMLLSLPRIKGYRVFRDYSWPDALHPFAKVNVIYGWNGSGKTTLSSLFEHIERRESLTKGDVTFQFAGGTVKGTELATAPMPAARVFNQQFVAKTISAVASGVDHIYYFGEESIEKHAQMVQLRADLNNARSKVKVALDAKANADDALDKFCTDKARQVKELLLGSPHHANYNKRKFEQAACGMDTATAEAGRLTDEDRQRLQSQRHAHPKPVVSRIVFTEPDLDVLTAVVADLLARTVVSQVLDALASDHNVASWVQTGLELHIAKRHTDTCRFCGGTLHPDRRSALAAHFNDAFKGFQREIDGLLRHIEQEIRTLNALQPPPTNAVYEHLADKLEAATDAANSTISAVRFHLEALRDELARKMAAPFELLDLALPVGVAARSPDVLRRASEAVNAVNTLIDEHRMTTEGLSRTVTHACVALERSAVAEAHAEFESLRLVTEEAERQRLSVLETPRGIEAELKRLEQEIVENRRPAEELNRELRNYLGRDELRFEVRDSGYVLLRGDQPVANLSEGEKTAIAFLYFLKSLQDRSFVLEQGIVIIDDPVSSLDQNNLFAAFSFMVDRTACCGQLFVLTHNFEFFRQARRVFKKKDTRYFLVRAVPGGSGVRSASIEALDEVLNMFDSDYHFLFSRVVDGVEQATAGTSMHFGYELPNVARRLVEAFLAFKFPDKQRLVKEALAETTLDASTRIRLERFLNVYSHGDAVMGPSHDPIALGETAAILKDVVVLMRDLDSSHYNGMLSALGRSCPLELAPER